MKAGWATKTFEELIEDNVIGLTKNSREQGEDKAWPYVKMNNITRHNTFDFSSFTCVDATDEELRKFTLQDGDFLFNTRNSHELVGKSCIYESDSNNAVLFNNNIMRVRFKSGVDSRFVLLAFSSKPVSDELNALKSGTTNVSAIYFKDLRSLVIPFPPLTEQQRIVGILDEAFAAIASAKAKAEQNLKNARALFESHLNEVFTQRGEGWVEKSLGEVCDFVGGSQPPKSEFEKNPSADNVRLIQIRDYKSDKNIVYIPKNQARRFCSSDDVMIGRYGPPLFQILRGIEGSYNVALMKAVPDESLMSKNFLFYFLRHSTILEYVIYHSERAAGQIGLTKETLEPYPIYLPSQNDQIKIVDKIVDLELETRRLESLYQRKIEELDALKKSLLEQAFSGQL